MMIIKIKQKTKQNKNNNKNLNNNSIVNIDKIHLMASTNQNNGNPSIIWQHLR